MFRTDCERHFFLEEEKQAVKTVLVLNPEYGRKIAVVRGPEGPKFNCEHLRVMEWAYSRNRRLEKAHILYAFVGDAFPIFLLRLEIDDARDNEPPFSNPLMWSRWAEALGELAEIALRAMT